MKLWGGMTLWSLIREAHNFYPTARRGLQSGLRLLPREGAAGGQVLPQVRGVSVPGAREGPRAAAGLQETPAGQCRAQPQQEEMSQARRRGVALLLRGVPVLPVRSVRHAEPAAGAPDGRLRWRAADADGETGNLAGFL